MLRKIKIREITSSDSGVCSEHQCRIIKERRHCRNFKARSPPVASLGKWDWWGSMDSGFCNNLSKEESHGFYSDTTPLT